MICTEIDDLELASCLTNALSLPLHCPAADDNSLIGCTCTSHDLTDDWSLASMHFVDSQYEFLCAFGYVLLSNLLFDHDVRQYHSDLSDQSGLEIRVRIRVRLKSCTILAFFADNKANEHLFVIFLAMFTFAICRRPSVCLSVCLSVVCL